jgi:hypothetical protein
MKDLLAVTAALHKAFSDTMRDPPFIAECRKLKLEVNFVSGQDVQDIITNLYAFYRSRSSSARELPRKSSNQHQKH